MSDKKSYVLLKPDEKNFFQTIDRINENTLTFENCSFFQKYCNKDLKYYEKSAKGLVEIKNIFLDKYIYKIREKSQLNRLTEELKEDFYCDPFRCSVYYTGYSDLWWIILAINGCTSVLEFKNFTHILVPNLRYLEEIMIKEFSYEYNQKIGEIQ